MFDLSDQPSTTGRGPRHPPSRRRGPGRRRPGAGAGEFVRSDRHRLAPADADEPPQPGLGDHRPRPAGALPAVLRPAAGADSRADRRGERLHLLRAGAARPARAVRGAVRRVRAHRRVARGRGRGRAGHPASRTALLLGRVLRDVVLLAVQGIVLASLSFAFGLRASVGGMLLGLVLVMIVGAACSAASNVARAHHQERGRPWRRCSTASSCPVLLLPGILLPISTATGAPQWLVSVSSVIPTRYVVDAVRAVFADDWSLTVVWGVLWALGPVRRSARTWGRGRSARRTPDALTLLTRRPAVLSVAARPAGQPCAGAPGGLRRGATRRSRTSATTPIGHPHRVERRGGPGAVVRAVDQQPGGAAEVEQLEAGAPARTAARPRPGRRPAAAPRRRASPPRRRAASSRVVGHERVGPDRPGADAVPGQRHRVQPGAAGGDGRPGRSGARGRGRRPRAGGCGPGGRCRPGRRCSPSRCRPGWVGARRASPPPRR